KILTFGSANEDADHLLSPRKSKLLGVKRELVQKKKAIFRVTNGPTLDNKQQHTFTIHRLVMTMEGTFEYEGMVEYGKTTILETASGIYKKVGKSSKGYMFQFNCKEHKRTLGTDKT